MSHAEVGDTGGDPDPGRGLAHCSGQHHGVLGPVALADPTAPRPMCSAAVAWAIAGRGSETRPGRM